MRDFFKRTGFFEKVRRSGHNLHLPFTKHFCICFLVHLDHWIVESADYQQRWGCDLRQGVTCKIRTSAARYHSADLLFKFCSGDQSRAAASARPEITDLQM